MASSEAPVSQPGFKALFLDLSGVLYDARERIPGALEAVELARRRNLVMRFVTNTASQSRQEVLSRLQHMGFDVQSEELFTAPDAALAYVKKHHLTPYALVHSSIKPHFDALAGDTPNCVILGDARDDLNYRNLNRAFQLARESHTLIAIGENKYFAEGDELWLDAGPFVRAIAWAADVEPIVMGKPARQFFEQVVASTPYGANECLMIGDDVFGDVEGALKAGLQARLVKTGKYQPGDEGKIEPAAETLDSIADLEALL